MHGVFTTHLIGKGGDLQRVFDPAHDVEIWHARFYHDHVRPLLQIEGALVDGFVQVGRIHLIGLFITAFNIARRTHGIAERSVVA